MDSGEISPCYKLKSPNGHFITKTQASSHLVLGLLCQPFFSACLAFRDIPAGTPPESSTSKELGPGPEQLHSPHPSFLLTSLLVPILCFKPAGPSNVGTWMWVSGERGPHQLRWEDWASWAWLLSTAWDSDPWRPVGDFRSSAQGPSTSRNADSASQGMPFLKIVARGKGFG